MPRATVLRFVQEGATVMAADRDLASAEETVAMARQHGPCVAFEADVTKEKMLAAMVAAAREKFGRIDVLHYNVGLSIAGGDAPPTKITEEAFDRIVAINLRGCAMAVKHVLPVMRAQRTGVILTISSLAAYENYPYVAYKATKAACAGLPIGATQGSPMPAPNAISMRPLRSCANCGQARLIIGQDVFI